MEDTRLVHALQNRQNGAMEQFQTAYTPLLRYIIAPSSLTSGTGRSACPTCCSGCGTPSAPSTRALWAAVERLGRRDRELFLRKYYYYQPTAQIAAESTPTRCPLSFWPPASTCQAGSGRCTSGPPRDSWLRKDSMIPESIGIGVISRGRRSMFRAGAHSSTPLHKTAPQPCVCRVAVLCYQYLFQQYLPPVQGMGTAGRGNTQPAAKTAQTAQEGGADGSAAQG